MSIITNNKATRLASGIRTYGMRLAFLGAVGAFVGLALGNTNSIDACELAALNLKNANRTTTSTPAEAAYKASRTEQATLFIKTSCPTAP